MQILASALLAAFPHGFTTRAGGASEPPWDSLNLGAGVGDAPGEVAENWRRLSEATGLAFAAQDGGRPFDASLEVVPGAGSSWSVDVHGTANARPTVERTGAKLAVRSPNSNVGFPFGNQRAGWRAELGTGTRFETLTLDLNAGDASVNLAGTTVSQLSFEGNAVGNTRLDLSSATVARLDVAVNAGDVAILLPAGADLQGEVEGNAASVDLCSPAGVGLRLLVDENITASKNYDKKGLVRSGNAWETPGYANAATRIELRTIGSAVSYTLNPEDGCR